MTQKAAAMGTRWLAFSSRQHTHSYITSRAGFFGKISNHTGDSAPLQPRFGALRLLAFPKLKSPLKGKRFQTIDEIQENTTGQLMASGRTVWGPKVPTLKGTEASLSYEQCFLYLVSSSVNVSIFHTTWLDTFWIYLVFFTRKLSRIYLLLAWLYEYTLEFSYTWVKLSFILTKESCFTYKSILMRKYISWPKH